MKRFGTACNVKVRRGSLYRVRRMNHRKHPNVKQTERQLWKKKSYSLRECARFMALEPTERVTCSVLSICGALFRTNYTLQCRRWTAPVNMLLCDASHPSHSSGGLPSLQSTGQTWVALSYTPDEEDMFRLSLLLCFSAINTQLAQRW